MLGYGVALSADFGFFHFFSSLSAVIGQDRLVVAVLIAF